jgi:hypothetical protein
MMTCYADICDFENDSVHFIPMSQQFTLLGNESPKKIHVNTTMSWGV